MEIISADVEGKWVFADLEAGRALPFGPGVTVFPLTGGRGCVLLARPGAAVNGSPSLPLCWLEHRDEVRSGKEVWYFSAESPARSTAFVAGRKPLHCARCKDELSPGLEVLYCPLCRAVYHENCWPYAPSCSACERPTRWVRWTPDVDDVEEGTDG